ncbi:MAG: TolC family protein [candidate division Zixibacteria bacterium]|nr:TolC family protein [candidate division Zixibacteria bacterium]
MPEKGLLGDKYVIKKLISRGSRNFLVNALLALFGLCAIGVGGLEARTLTLDEALEMAFVNSPTMKRVGYSLDMSRHNLQAQQAALKSQFSLNLMPYQFSKSRRFETFASDYVTSQLKGSNFEFSINQPIKWTDGTFRLTETFSWEENTTIQPQVIDSFSPPQNVESIREAFTNNLVVSYTQPLFTYNRTKLELKELELALENAQLNYAIQKLQIEQQVTESFLNLYYLKRSVQIAKEELVNSTESFGIIQSKVEAGISAKEELFQADLTQANSRASLENRDMQYDNSLDNFKILLGLSLDDELDVETDIQKLIIDVSLAHAINYGLSSRMELRQRDIDIQNALNSLIRTGAQNEFRGTLNLSYGLTGVDGKVRDMYNSPTRTQGFNVSFNVPLFDWGQKKHRIQSAETQVEQSRLTADEERKNVKYQIRQSFRNLQNQKLQIEIAEKNVTNARLTYDINLEKYKNGDLSSKDLSFYQNQLSSEQLNEVSALINYQVALLELKIRTLWDFQENQSVITGNEE